MTEPNDAPAAEPPYFSVSPTKLVVMTLCTFGLYEVYWFYKNWSLIKERESLNIKPFWRGFFSIIFCHPCFEHIEASAQKLGLANNINALALAAGWIITTLLWKLPDPFWLLTNFAVLFLLPVQRVANEINRAASPDHEVNAGFGGWNIFGVVVGGLLFVLSFIGAFIPNAAAVPQ